MLSDDRERKELKMKIWLILMITCALTAPAKEAIVDRVEENYAVIEVAHGEKTKIVNVPVEDFNHSIGEGNEIISSKVNGEFEAGFKDIDGNTYYQFKSYDDTVWWALTAEEIGFLPQENKAYTLVYYNNCTTDCTECAEELECECEVYDDIFLAVFEGGN